MIEDLKTEISELSVRDKIELLNCLYHDLSGHGTDGDTELAHINVQEAAILKALGGSGTVNEITGLRQYGKGGGSPAPAPSSTSQTMEIPAELKPYITDILAKSQAIQEKRTEEGYRPYQGQQLAEFTPEQQRAMQGISGLVGTSQQYLDPAARLTAASAMTPTGEEVSQYMSPYMQQVVDIQQREARRQADVSGQQLASEAVQRGAFGGSRQAILEAEAARNLQTQLGDIQARGLAGAYEDAQRRLAEQRQRQLAGGAQFAQMAPTAVSTGLQELGALQQAGGMRQAQSQAALDIARQQFEAEKAFPEQTLQQYSSIIRGYAMDPNTTVTKYTPAPSTLQQITGLGVGTAALGKSFGLFNEGGKVGDGKGLASIIVRRKHGGKTVKMQKGGSILDQLGLPEDKKTAALKDIDRLGYAYITLPSGQVRQITKGDIQRTAYIPLSPRQPDQTTATDFQPQGPAVPTPQVDTPRLTQELVRGTVPVFGPAINVANRYFVRTPTSTAGVGAGNADSGRAAALEGAKEPQAEGPQAGGGGAGGPPAGGPPAGGPPAGGGGGAEGSVVPVVLAEPPILSREEQRKIIFGPALYETSEEGTAAREQLIKTEKDREAGLREVYKQQQEAADKYGTDQEGYNELMSMFSERGRKIQEEEEQVKKEFESGKEAIDKKTWLTLAKTAFSFASPKETGGFMVDLSRALGNSTEDFSKLVDEQQRLIKDQRKELSSISDKKLSLIAKKFDISNDEAKRKFEAAKEALLNKEKQINAVGKALATEYTLGSGVTKAQESQATAQAARAENLAKADYYATPRGTSRETEFGIPVAEITKELANKFKVPSGFDLPVALPRQLKIRIRDYIQKTNPSIMTDIGDYKTEEARLLEKLYDNYTKDVVGIRKLEEALKSPLQFKNGY